MQRRDVLLASLVSARLEHRVGTLSPEDWLRTVEQFATNIGARSILSHVTPADWIRHYAANEDAFSAVVDELKHTD